MTLAIFNLMTMFVLTWVWTSKNMPNRLIKICLAALCITNAVHVFQLAGYIVKV